MNYLSHAGAVYHGDFTYTELSCKYPAGHLWHFVPIYWLHMQSPYAELIVRALFMLMHTVSMMVVTKISYIYFISDMTKATRNEKTHNKAQMIAFILMANTTDNFFASMVYND